MPGHYRMKGTKNMGMNKKMSMNKAQTKAAVPKKGSAAMKKKDGCSTS